MHVNCVGKKFFEEVVSTVHWIVNKLLKRCLVLYIGQCCTFEGFILLKELLVLYGIMNWSCVVFLSQ